MVKTGNDCQLTDYRSSRGKNCYGSLLRESVVPTKCLSIRARGMCVVPRPRRKCACHSLRLPRARGLAGPAGSVGSVGPAGPTDSQTPGWDL